MASNRTANTRFDIQLPRFAMLYFAGYKAFCGPTIAFAPAGCRANNALGHASGGMLRFSLGSRRF